jgi:hypothetical protein
VLIWGDGASGGAAATTEASGGDWAGRAVIELFEELAGAGKVAEAKLALLEDVYPSATAV